MPQMSRVTWFSHIESKLKHSSSDITCLNFEMSLRALVSDSTSLCNILKCQLWLWVFHKVGFTESCDSPVPKHTNYVLFYRSVSEGYGTTVCTYRVICVILMCMKLPTQTPVSQPLTTLPLHLQGLWLPSSAMTWFLVLCKSFLI